MSDIDTNVKILKMALEELTPERRTEIIIGIVREALGLPQQNDSVPIPGTWEYSKWRLRTVSSSTLNMVGIDMAAIEHIVLSELSGTEANEFLRTQEGKSTLDAIDILGNLSKLLRCPGYERFV